MNDNTTIKVVLYSRRDKNNLYPVKIRLTKNRKSSFINLGFSIEKKYWLKSTNRVSSSHSNSIDYNFQIEKKLKDLESLNTTNIKNIIGSKTFDNGTICASEQSIICEKGNEEEVVRELEKNGGYFMNKEETEKVCSVLPCVYQETRRKWFRFRSPGTRYKHLSRYILRTAL